VITGYVLMNVDASFPRILMTQLTAMMSPCQTWSHRPACIRIIALKYCLLYCISTPRTTLCARIINFVVKKKCALCGLLEREIEVVSVQPRGDVQTVPDQKTMPKYVCSSKGKSKRKKSGKIPMRCSLLTEVGSVQALSLFEE